MKTNTFDAGGYNETNQSNTDMENSEEDTETYAGPLKICFGNNEKSVSFRQQEDSQQRKTPIRPKKNLDGLELRVPHNFIKSRTISDQVGTPLKPIRRFSGKLYDKKVNNSQTKLQKLIDPAPKPNKQKFSAFYDKKMILNGKESGSWSSAEKKSCGKEEDALSAENFDEMHLYIQTELCEETLENYMEQRDAEIYKFLKNDSISNSELQRSKSNGEPSPAPQEFKFKKVQSNKISLKSFNNTKYLYEAFSLAFQLLTA